MKPTRDSILSGGEHGARSMGFRLARDFGRQATTLLCLWVSVGWFATCNAARLTLGVPLDAVAFRGMVGGWQAARPAELGSRGDQSPGCGTACAMGRGAGVMCAGARHAPPQRKRNQ